MMKNDFKSYFISYFKGYMVLQSWNPAQTLNLFLENHLQFMHVYKLVSNADILVRFLKKPIWILAPHMQLCFLLKNWTVVPEQAYIFIEQKSGF